MWNRYRVTGATVEVRWCTENTTDVYDCFVSVQNSSQSRTLTGQVEAYAAQWPGTQFITMAPGGEHKSQIGPFYVDLKKLEGEPWITRADDYQALTTTSPAITPYLRLAVCNRSADTQVSIRYFVKIVYYVTFFDAIIPDRST